MSTEDFTTPPPKRRKRRTSSKDGDLATGSKEPPVPAPAEATHPEEGAEPEEKQFETEADRAWFLGLSMKGR